MDKVDTDFTTKTNSELQKILLLQKVNQLERRKKIRKNQEFLKKIKQNQEKQRIKALKQKRQKQQILMEEQNDQKNSLREEYSNLTNTEFKNLPQFKIITQKFKEKRSIISTPITTKTNSELRKILLLQKVNQLERRKKIRKNQEFLKKIKQNQEKQRIKALKQKRQKQQKLMEEQKEQKSILREKYPNLTDTDFQNLPQFKIITQKFKAKRSTPKKDSEKEKTLKTLQTFFRKKVQIKKEEAIFRNLTMIFSILTFITLTILIVLNIIILTKESPYLQYTEKIKTIEEIILSIYYIFGFIFICLSSLPLWTISILVFTIILYTYFMIRVDINQQQERTETIESKIETLFVIKLILMLVSFVLLLSKSVIIKTISIKDIKNASKTAFSKFKKQALQKMFLSLLTVGSSTLAVLFWKKIN